MANKTFQGRIVQKHDTEANWKKATNFVPLKGEIIIYDDLKKIKIGDGTTTVGNLTFSNDLDTLATVATSGSYNDLKDKPTIPTAISQLEDDTTFIINMTGNGTTDSPYTSDHSSEEVFAAVRNGKKIYLKAGLILAPIVQTQTGQMAAFSYLDNSSAVLYTLSGNKITTTVIPLQTINNKTTTITSSSTDTQYPSAKAVYDNLQNYLPLSGGTLNGSLTIKNLGNKLIVNTVSLSGKATLNSPCLQLSAPDDNLAVFISGVKSPLYNTDAANKEYVDAIVSNHASATIVTWTDGGT